MKPLCFVLMPFGRKHAGDGRLVDFDAVYKKIILPGITNAGLVPLRADEEIVGGIIHKPMFERLVLCEYAVADLTTANANVFYELGVRHAARPWATQLLFADGWGRLPFDVASLRAQPYGLDAGGMPIEAERDAEALAGRLREAQKAAVDSPLFQLLEGFPEVKHLKTDVFRERLRFAEDVKAKLAAARGLGVDALTEVEIALGDLGYADSAVVVDLFLSYRSVEAWDRMIDVASRMSPPLASTVMVREQVGFALNRAGKSNQAERWLLDVIRDRGASSETCGILGRVYKDKWQVAVRGGHTALANGWLDKAIEAYIQGFETDWRDAYPGVNAVTLMESKNPVDPRQAQLLPVVRYAVLQKIARGQFDYWDRATLLELAILANDQRSAESELSFALAAMRDAWEGETTAKNLSILRDVRQRRGDDVAWILASESALLTRFDK